MPEYKDNLQNLVVTAGGVVLKSKEELLSQNSDEKAFVILCFTVIISPG